MSVLKNDDVPDTYDPWDADLRAYEDDFMAAPAPLWLVLVICASILTTLAMILVGASTIAGWIVG